jgi:hypothetical protein
VTTPDSRHLDVAAYALGVLDNFDTDRFERHLAYCDVCAAELERLLPAVSALSEVDAEAFLPAEQIVRDGALLDRLLDQVSREREQARVQRLLSVAAAVAVLVMVAVGAAIAGERWAAERPGATSGDRTAGVLAEPSAAEPRPSSSETPAVKHFSATDPVSGAHLEVDLEAQPWGTQLSLVLSHVTGPLDCQLYALDRTGTRTVVATWEVDRQGYGTVGHPEPLLVPAGTALARSELVRLLVRAVAPDGSASELVAVTL